MTFKMRNKGLTLQTQNIGVLANYYQYKYSAALFTATKLPRYLPDRRQHGHAGVESGGGHAAAALLQHRNVC